MAATAPILSDQFSQWLLANPTLLQSFIAIIKQWYESQGQLPPETPPNGPGEFVPGGEQVITTVGISDTDLDALYKGYGIAVQKERVIAYIKGFITGIMLVSGGA
jgi:hypothetical protein